MGKTYQVQHENNVITLRESLYEKYQRKVRNKLAQKLHESQKENERIKQETIAMLEREIKVTKEYNLEQYTLGLQHAKTLLEHKWGLLK